MSNTLNLNDITRQIQQYVSQIKGRKFHSSGEISETKSGDVRLYSNDVTSNIHKLNGESKFKIHSMLEREDSLGIGDSYAVEAYSHLDNLNEKNKVVIDFMHKNNRNFDVKA